MDMNWKFLVAAGSPLVVLPLCVMGVALSGSLGWLFTGLAAVGLGFQLFCLALWVNEDE